MSLSYVEGVVWKPIVDDIVVTDVEFRVQEALRVLIDPRVANVRQFGHECPWLRASVGRPGSLAMQASIEFKVKREITAEA
jgi:hypothetical protein